MVVKQNLGSHGGNNNPPMSFDQAYEFCLNNPDVIFETTGNQTPFSVQATVGQRGDHRDQPVLRFFSNNTERARSYRCCWPYQTNCIKQHIDCYSEAIVQNI